VIEDASVELLVSASSAWEIATKHRLGKLPDATPIVLSYARNLDRLGAHELPISSRHALAAGDLAWDHRDPFDRILAAQSILDGLPLVTSDAAFAPWADCTGSGDAKPTAPCGSHWRSLEPSGKR
jgi:PIN domain nuclease of toxin-antitoxin system